MPRPLPRWTRTGALVGCFPIPRGPSPVFRRVGVHHFTFEACSGFTRVAACGIAQPPKGGLGHEASTRPVAPPCRSSATRAYRQLSGWLLPPLVNRAVEAHDVLRASEPQRPVEGMDSDLHLGDPALVRVRAQPIADHALEPGDGGFGSRPLRVSG